MSGNGTTGPRAVFEALRARSAALEARQQQLSSAGGGRCRVFVGSELRRVERALSQARSEEADWHTRLNRLEN
jgi:hypothetical protein